MTVTMRKVKEGKNINQYESEDPNVGIPSLYVHKKLGMPNKIKVTVEATE